MCLRRDIRSSGMPRKSVSSSFTDVDQESLPTVQVTTSTPKSSIRADAICFDSRTRKVVRASPLHSAFDRTGLADLIAYSVVVRNASLVPLVA